MNPARAGLGCLIKSPRLGHHGFRSLASTCARKKKEGKDCGVSVTGPVSECNKAETAALLAVDVDEFPVRAEVLLRIFYIIRKEH